MQFRLIFSTIFVLLSTAAAQAAPTVELEIVTEPGVQITAPHEWLQLLTALGINNVRIRGVRAGDQPDLSNVGTDDRPRYHAVGVLTARDELRLPGGTFRAGDRRGLADYFRRLADDGVEAMTAQRGRFGLTEKQLAAVFAELAQPIEFETKGQPILSLLERLQAGSKVPIAIDPQANRVLRAAKPVADEIRGLTTGTGLAILLRANGLVLRPEKPQGKPLVLRIAAADSDADNWPVGWEPKEPPVQLAPAMFAEVNVEIEGYTLAEALAAICPRIKVPWFLDHATLAEQHVDPDTIQVALPRTRTYYKRILDRILSQAKLGGRLRIDEAGTVFYWITR
jgi:hypothetical protein